MVPVILCLLLSCSLLANGELSNRLPRQAPPPLFFQNGLQPHRPGPVPKGQQFPVPLIPKFSSFGNAPPQGFRTAPSVDEEEDEEEIEKNSIAPSPIPSSSSPLPSQQLLHYRQSPSPTTQQQSQQLPHQQVIQYRPTSPSTPIIQQPIASAQVLQPQQTLLLKGRIPQQQEQSQYRKPVPQQLIKNQLSNQAVSEEELEEKEEPDRLTELLPQSKFSCNGRKTGYYADDGLGCEVFHYCQDNARHSWICPEGFSFHQVHLICMPPSSDNICQQSSQFHFVNDFLYRPINIEEAQSRPNVSIRYADRYYPENYYETSNDDENGERTFHQRQPIEQASVPRPRPAVAQPFQPTLRPLAQIPQHFTRQPFNSGNQVYHSAEEVNIPLQNRRPTPGPTQRIPTPSQNNFDFENK